MDDNFDLELANIITENRSRFLAIARMRMNPKLMARLTPEDILQEAYLYAAAHTEALKVNPDVPLFIKMRTVLIQSVARAEEKYLGAQKRDVFKEADMHAAFGDNENATQLRWNQLADSMVSPRTQLAQAERHELVRNALETLPETDREIIQLRLFEQLTNTEAAHVLSIEPKAASIRYVRAVKRFKEKVQGITVFKL